MLRINLSNDDGSISSQWFDKDKAESWDEAAFWDGHNWISKITRSQFNHERLYKTASGSWILNKWSQYQGTPSYYLLITKDDALEWLTKNEHFDIVTSIDPDYLVDSEI